MSGICNILVIVDPTASEHPAVEKAAKLAVQCDARLELFICDTRTAREMRLAAERSRDPGRMLDVNLKPWLEKLAQPIRARGVDVTSELEYADALHEGLLSRVKRTTTDLVVKDTHHHSLAKRTFVTNTDWYLIRECPVPLLLTKTNPWRSAPKIVAAVDPGHVNDKPATLDQRILEFAALIAKRLNGELHAAHAYLPLTILAAASSGAPPAAAVVSAGELEAERAARHNELSSLTKNFNIEASCLHLEMGSATEYLPRIAGTLGADIMTMGAVSRTGLKRIFIGHTAEAVLERLPCDALIVKPLNFETATAS